MVRKFGTLIEPGTIEFEQMLPGPIGRIWEYLTKSELKGRWLAAGEVEPRIGGKVELHFKNSNLSETDDPTPEKYKDMEDGAFFEGKVTNWNPPYLLSYTWSEDSGEESEVTFELIPKDDNKVLLRLTHRRLGDERDMLIGVAAGWHTHLGILAERLEGKKVRGFWSVHTKMEKAYAKRI